MRCVRTHVRLCDLEVLCQVMLNQESSETIESSHPGYKFGNQGSKTCANGGTPITNREQCDSALKSLGIKLRTLSPGSNVCYKGGSGKGYNNGHNGGGAWLICKVSVSPTTATPTTATPTTATPTTATPTTASGDEMTKALVQGTTTTACHGYRKPIAYALCRCTYAPVS